VSLSLNVVAKSSVVVGLVVVSVVVSLVSSSLSPLAVQPVTVQIITVNASKTARIFLFLFFFITNFAFGFILIGRIIFAPTDLNCYFWFLYGFFSATQPSLFTCLALAIESASSGMLSVIVEPAAMYAISPTLTGAIRFVLQPINAPSPISHLDLTLPS